MRLLSTLIFLITLANSSPVLAQKKSAGERDVYRPRVEAMVEMLASRNKAPEGTHWSDVPEGYDTREQAVVFLAIHQLMAEGSAAFDELIEHFDDPRYCYSYESPNGRYSTTVGGTCRRIMRRSVECYESELHYITADQASVFWRKQGDVKKWWSANRKRPLWEIQIEAIDSAIAFMEEVRVDTARATHPRAEMLPEEQFEKARKDNVAKLKALRVAIEAVKEPHYPRDIESAYGTMCYLPWPSQKNFGR